MPDTKTKDSTVIKIDFVGGAQYNRRKIKSKDDIFRKAFPKASVDVVWDCTAGLCVDAIHFLRLGLRVVAVEREAWLFEVLREALILARSADPVFNNLEIVFGDATRLLPDRFEQNVGIYIDPMFEETGSALPKKNMQMLRQKIQGPDTSLELCEMALSTNAKRVIVKRSLKAPVLMPGYIHQIKGKAVRFDLYLPKNSGIQSKVEN